MITFKKKIGIFHPRFIAGGGSEARPLWIIETLKNDYEFTLITMGDFNLKRLNKCYGTSLGQDDFKIISIPIPFLLRKRFDALKSYRLSRYCKKHAAEFDLMISTYNIMDFGRRGIQFITDLSFDDELRRKYEFSEYGEERVIYRKSFARSIYLKLGVLLSGISENSWKKNITIANSHWSGCILNEAYGIETKTIYPPVLDDFSTTAWNKRENGFVILARIVPLKRIDRLIEIVRQVRKMDNDVHLHLLGRMDDSAYGRKIKELAEKNHEWCFLEGLITGQKKNDFINKHRFSISGCVTEAFGIAVAETVKAGCITWVPHGGGQTEIVNHPELIYDDLNDAVSKIAQVLKDDLLQNELQAHLKEQSEKLSIKRFQSEIKNLIDQVLNDSRKIQG